MQKDSSYFKELFQLYLDDRCMPMQMKELFAFLNENENNRFLLEKMHDEFSALFMNTNDGISGDLKPGTDEVSSGKIIFFRRKRWLNVAVAVVLVLIGFAAYFFLNEKSAKYNSLAEKTQSPQVISSGEDKAVLILGNGEQIILDSSLRGTIALQGNAVISKNKNGQIVYDAGGHNVDKTAEVVYNTVKTPIGGFFKVILPDGTNVWLNANSSIYFPTRFTGNERKIALNGEAYFEVTKNKKKPFRVTIRDNETIEVLGTHFNVMAYEDEPGVQTTLLEGSIKMSNEKGSVFVKPGQLAISQKSKKIELINNVNTEHAIAWKNGLFDFDNDNLPYIMRQLTRWYNVDIIYQENIPQGHYVGSIRKQSNIREVLKMLELAGDVHFSIIGKKILVK